MKPASSNRDVQIAAGEQVVFQLISSAIRNQGAPADEAESFSKAALNVAQALQTLRTEP